jgi:hypothetical protein
MQHVPPKRPEAIYHVIVRQIQMTYIYIQYSEYLTSHSCIYLIII